MNHKWQLEISGVRINAEHPATCVVTLSPVEKLLLDSNPLLRPGLVRLYREAIERGDYRTYGFSGGGEHHVEPG